MSEPAVDPLVPPIPSGIKRAAKQRKRGDGRMLVWLFALGLGVALGVLSYRYVPAVKSYFGYWEARALS